MLYYRYECKAGSTSPIPLAGKCSQGYYCPTTSLVPVKCAAGTYMHLTGMGKSTQCISCPAGRYCPIGSKTQDSLPLCKAGYICKTGATIDSPASNMGFSCPIGHYCLSGSIQPIQCKPGTYQDVVGQDKCKSCLIGHMCPVSGVSVPIDCPKGFYCIAGITDEMKPCPTGTYNDLINQSTSIACKTCPPKKYCDGEGLDQPTGDCESGYICASGSTTPKPKVLDLNGNQPCPVGMYCSKSSSVGIKCPIGTIRYNIGARAITDCYPCAAGYFCDTLGLSTLTGSCNKGYFCPSIDKTSTKEPSAYKCPTGHYCPSKSAQPIPCPPGTFQANVQSFQCVPCTEGYYCSESTTTPTKCPPYNYCIKGSSSPKLCEPGTYSLSSDSCLIDATKCKLCVIGKYCINGRITDNCSAGYYCVSKNSSPTPDNVKLPIIGSSCPFGYYCESGTIKPSVCPEGKVINKIGASHIDECDLCPAGKQCLLGVVLPIPCEVGNYCAYNVDMKKCPNSTYLGYTGATSILECKSCPSGYFCSTEGISDYSTYVCPIGSYCPIGTVQPYKCPKGTYRKLTKGKSISDCGMCDVGYYCPVIGASSLTLKCEYGDYCPVRTILPSNCPIGYYCPLTTVKIPCPIGKYCPERSESPIACPIGHYCQSVMDLKLDVEITNAHLILLHTPKLCPFGYSFKKIAKQTTLSNSCDPCQSGYYGNHTERLYCNPCKPGVVCPLLANNDDLSVSLESVNSFICPKGHYCPERTEVPISCIEGYYNDQVGSVKRSDCKPCPINEFSPIKGNDKCYSCGGKAFQTNIGQSTCICSENTKIFQPSDKSCVCKQDYNSIKSGSIIICSKRIFSICGWQEYRNEYGECWTLNQWKDHCKSKVCIQKKADFVKFDIHAGICICGNQKLDSICDLKCRIRRENAMQWNCNLKARDKSKFLLSSQYFATNKTKKIASSCLSLIPNHLETISDEYCSNLRSNKSETFNFISTSTIGFNGVYTYNLLDLYNIFLKNSKCGLALNQNLQESHKIGDMELNLINSKFMGIQNPIICCEIDTLFIFTVNKNNYPEYDRDNIFNVNDHFDYGGFRNLINFHTILSTRSSLFAFRFNSPGAYVFHLSSDVTKKMYIRVVPSEAECINVGPYYPTNYQYFLKFGFGHNKTFQSGQNWTLIVIIMSIMTVGIFLVFLVNYIFYRKGWDISKKQILKYKDIAKSYNFQCFFKTSDKLGSFSSSVREAKESKLFDVNCLYSELNQQNNFISQNLKKNHQNALVGYDQLCEKIKVISNILSTKIDENSSISPENFTFLSNHLKFCYNEIKNTALLCTTHVEFLKIIVSMFHTRYDQLVDISTHLVNSIKNVKVEKNCIQNATKNENLKKLDNRDYIKNNKAIYEHDRYKNYLNLKQPCRIRGDVLSFNVEKVTIEEIDVCCTKIDYTESNNVYILKPEYKVFYDNKEFVNNSVMFCSELSTFISVQNNILYESKNNKILSIYNSRQFCKDEQLLPLVILSIQDYECEIIQQLKQCKLTNHDVNDAFIIDSSTGFYLPILAIGYCVENKSFVPLGMVYTDPFTTLLHPMQIGALVAIGDEHGICVGVHFENDQLRPTVISFTESNEEIMEILFKELDHYEYNLFAIYNDFIKNSINEKPKLADIPENSENLNMDKEIIFCKETLKKIELITSLLFDHYFISLSKYMGILNVSLDIQSNLSQPEFYIDIKSGFEFPMLIGQKMIKWEKEKVNLNAKILGIHKKSTLKNENDKLYIPLYGNIKQGTEWKKIEISMLIKDPIDGQESKVNGLFYDEKLDVIIPRTLSNTKHPLKPVEIKLTFDDLNNERIEIERYYSGLDYFIIGIRKYLVQFVIECENFKIIERIEGTEGADDQNPEIEELSLIKLDEFYKRFCSFKYNFKKRIGNVLYNPYIYYLLENFDKYLTEFVNDFVKEAHRCSSLCSNFCIQSKNISNMFREQFMDIYVCTSDSKMVSKSSIEALESLKAKFKKIGENLVLKYKTTLYKKCINLDEIFTKMNTIKVSHRSLIKILLSNVKNGHANHFYLYIKDKEFSHAGLETNVAENETSALAKLLSNVLNILNSNQNQNLNDKNKSKSNSETKIDNVSIVGKYLKDFSTCTHESNIQKYLSTYNIEHDYKVGNLFIGQISYIFNILWTNIINDGKKTTDIVHGFINKFCVDLQEKIEKINKIDKIAKSSSNNVNSLDHYQKNFNENQSNVSYFVQNLFDNFTKTISSFIEDRTLDKLNKIRELELFYRNENIKEKFEIFLNIGYQDIKNGTMEFIGNVIKNYVKFFESLNGIDSLDSNSDFDSYYEFASNLKELNIWANNYVQNIQILPSNEFLSQNLTFLLKYLLKLELVSHQISIIHQEGLCRSWTDKTNKLLKFNLKLTKFCQFYYISQMGDALKNSCQDLVDEDNKLYIKSLNLLISSITDSTQNIIFSLKIPLSTSWLSNFHEIWEKYKNIPFKLITEQPPTHLTPTDTKNYMEEYIKIYKNTRETIIGKYTQRFESISIDLSQEILEIQLNKKIYHYTPIQVDELLKTIIMQNKTISNEIISIHTKKMANYLQNLIMQCHYKIKLENKLIYMYKNVSNLQISSKIMKNYLDRDLTPIFEMEHDILKLNNLHQNINESTAEVFIESMTLCRHAMEKMCTMVELKCFNLLKLSANEINLINHRNQFIYTLNSLKDVENHEIFTDIYIKHVNDKEQSQIHLIYIEKLLLFHYYKFIENVNLIKFVLNLFKKNLSKSKLDSVDAVNGLFNLLILNVGNQIKVSKENTVSCHSFLEQDSNIIQKNFKLNETALSDTINLIKIEENNLIENEFIIQKNFLNQQFLIDSDSTKIVNADNPNECQKLLNNLENEKNQFIDRLNFNKEKSFESLSNRLDCLRGKFNQDSKNELDIKNRIQHESRIKSMVCNFIENKTEKLIPDVTTNEVAFVDLLLMSPCFEKVKSIHDTLDNMVKNSKQQNGNQFVIGGDYTRSILDIEDCQYQYNQTLKIVDSKSLNNEQVLMIQFGEFLLKKMMIKITEYEEFGVYLIKKDYRNILSNKIKIAAASEIPNNGYHSNCFRYSVFYQEKTKTLYVRFERFSNIGSFILILIHSLSHILIGNMINDYDDNFINIYFELLKFIHFEYFESINKLNKKMICNDTFSQETERKLLKKSKEMQNIDINFKN